MSRVLVRILAALLVVYAFVDIGIAGRPDIAVLLTDQQQAEAIGVTGTPGVSTPAMDALARGGVRFTRAFCATPQCSPARAAMWTGRYPHRTGVMGNIAAGPKPPAGMSPPLATDIPTTGKIFSSAGYETAYFGKWHLGRDPGHYGFQTSSAGNLRGQALAERVIEYLKQRPTSKRQPLLLIASWVNPHDIYEIRQSRDLDLPGGPQVRLPISLSDDLLSKPFPQRHYRDADQGKAANGYTTKNWENYIRYYYQLTANVDAEIGLVIKELRNRNPDTLIVFLSDHGDLAGAHGLPFKGPAMYEELIRVPLIFSWPGTIAPAVCDELVGQIDLLPTLCDLAGIGIPDDIDGRSLRSLLQSRTASMPVWPDAVFVEYYGKQNWRVPIRMIRTKSFKYVRYLQYGQELYNLQTDPHELTNLADSDAHQAKRQELADRLDQWIKQTRDPFGRLTVTDRDGQVIDHNRK